MATTVYTYNHTSQKLLQLGIDNQANNFYLELLNSSAVFDATDTEKSQVDNVGGYEVYGSGWPQGGFNLEDMAVSGTATNGAKIVCSDVSQAVTGTVGPVSNILIYVNEDGLGTTKIPLWFHSYSTPKTAVSGESYEVAFSADGISRHLVV